MLVSVFKNKVNRQCVWFTSNQTSEMMRLLRCYGTAHPIHLSAGNTGPPPISDWTDSSYCLLLKAIFSLVLGLLKTRPCCSGASITHAAALHMDTWAACFPNCPGGKYGFVCPAQQVSTSTCDAVRSALEAAIRPRLWLHKRSEPHWFKVYTIDGISRSVRRVNTWVSMCHKPFTPCFTSREASRCDCEETLWQDKVLTLWHNLSYSAI